MTVFEHGDTMRFSYRETIIGLRNFYLFIYLQFPWNKLAAVKLDRTHSLLANVVNLFAMSDLRSSIWKCLG